MSDEITWGDINRWEEAGSYSQNACDCCEHWYHPEELEIVQFDGLTDMLCKGCIENEIGEGR